MSTEFASASLTAGQLNAIVKKLGGYEGAIKLLQGKLLVSEPKRTLSEEENIINFSVTSDGTTGEAWIVRLESQGFHLNEKTKKVLRSPDFKPTHGVTTEVVVFKSWFFGERPNTYSIRAEADKRKLQKPNAEVACLIREKFTDEEIEAMGLFCIIVMHESIVVDIPVNPYPGCVGPAPKSYLLSAGNSGVGRWLSTSTGSSHCGWDHGRGFAFAAS